MERFSYSRNGDNGLVDQNCLVRVQLPAVDTVGKRVVYVIRVTNLETRQSWEVARRFSEFLKLRNELLTYFGQENQKKCPGCVNYEKVLRLFEFPRKHIFTSDSPVVLNYRKVALRSFVALLASHTFTTTPKCPTCSGFAFTAVQEFLTQELKPMMPARGTSTDMEDVPPLTPDAIRESMDVKKFTDSRPAAKLRQVDSNGNFVHANSGKKPRSVPPQQKQKQKPTHIHTPAKPAAGEEDFPSPPNSATGSSSASFSDPASPVAVLPAARHEKEAVNDEVVEDEGSFVSFTSGARPKRSSRASRASRASRHSAKSMTKQQGGSSVGVVVKTKKSEKKRLNFSRKQQSASSPRRSMESAGGDDEREPDANADEVDDDEINLDFLKNVSIAAK
uniref:PX domain-containing protein n=1 Tax=Globisporangium ultimum (strain ATCC 200006 / CBS 805.95 / DAOM BR144) TaxID=431595 RepID=K3W713_GLOUD